MSETAAPTGGGWTAFGRFISYASRHPTTRRQPLRTAARIMSWQLFSRLAPEPRRCRWISGAQLVVGRGESGATGNLYYGLHEFADMSFVLHFLRPSDVFLDIGANVGSHTVLAAKLASANVHAFEPDPQTARRLRGNIEVNGIQALVTVHEHAVGDHDGVVRFTVGQDSMNRVSDNPDEGCREVRIYTLDSLKQLPQPIMMKVDVEGFEEQVFAGGSSVLENGDLKAIEVETVSLSLDATLRSAGFERLFYDPINRKLGATPFRFPANNHLYIRDRNFVAQRLSSATTINLYGWRY